MPDAPGGPAEPDPRFLLANERTFLAWLRTILAILAGAVALHSLQLPDPEWLRRALVAVLLLLGAGVTVAAYLRWRAVDRSIRTGTPMPGFAIGAVLALVVVVAALLLVVALA